MEILFKDESIDSCFKELKDQIENDIKNIPDDEFIGTSLDDWSSYYVDKYTIEPIELFPDNVSSSKPLKTKIRVDLGYSLGVGMPNVTQLVDGYSFTIKIPFYGFRKLLFAEPRIHYLTNVKVDDVEYDYGNHNGVLVFNYELPEKKVQSFDLDRFVSSRVDEIKKYVMHNNEDSKSFNLSLKEFVDSVLDKRKKSFDSSLLLLEKLNLDLDTNTGKKEIRLVEHGTKLSKPKKSHYDTKCYYSISDEDYCKIVEVIDSYYGKLENTPRVGFDSNEECLRDMILPVLSTTFSINAVGEAFRCKGKTDILIEFENRAAFIGECKIWHGKKTIDEAIKQIFHYTTWRDSKVSLILFNKNNKDYLRLLKEIELYLKDKKNYSKVKDGQYRFQVYNESNNNLILISVLIFNYYLEK